MTKTIGILTSGGDCPGINAAIRAIIAHAVGTYSWTVLGILQGTEGLLAAPTKTVRFDNETVTDELLRQGGTILGTTKSANPLAYPLSDGTTEDRTEAFLKGYHELGLDALIAIGGDGSLAIMDKLVRRTGINLITIPKTIDNDVGLTNNSIGFDTAVNIATEAIDRLHTTGHSHDSLMLLEVMGRDAGHIALSAGIAGGADIILIPEIPYRFQNIYSHISRLSEQGRKDCLIVVAEGKVADPSVNGCDTPDSLCRFEGSTGDYIACQIKNHTSSKPRATVLGYVQRGGTPSPKDRIIAAACGVRAVDLIEHQKFGYMTVWRDGEILNVPLEDVVASSGLVYVDGDLVKTARSLGICFGD